MADTNNNQQQYQGFTIIEVMIVLVIAAVILLIVFLAVPALQRNSRNTQRKNDAAGILAAVNEYASNNGNTYPTTATQITGNVKLGIFDPAKLQLTNLTSGGSTTWNNGAASTDFDISTVVTNGYCTSFWGVNVTGFKARSVAILYPVESGSGGTMLVLCLDS